MYWEHRKLNWLDWYLFWFESSLDTHFIWLCFFFVSRFKRRHCRYVHLFYAKTVFAIAKKVHIYLWAITLYYSTILSRLRPWRKVNPTPVITFYSCKICWYLKLCTKTYYDLTVGPLLFNRTWALRWKRCLDSSYVVHTGMFIKWASPSQGGGGVFWYFHTYIGLGQFLGLKILNFNIFFCFLEKWTFLGV